MFLVNLLRSDCFGNLDIVESVVEYLFVIDLYEFFSAVRTICKFGISLK